MRKEYEESYVRGLKTRLAKALGELNHEIDLKTEYKEAFKRLQMLHDSRGAEMLSERAANSQATVTFQKNAKMLSHMVEYYRWVIETVSLATVYRDETCRWISADVKNNARHALLRVFSQEGEDEKSIESASIAGERNSFRG